MSLSFDESSSLYVNPPSPPNGEKEENPEKKSSEHSLSPPSSPPSSSGLTPTSYSSHSPGKHKKSSKGLSGLLSRAKEGAKKTKAALKHPIPKSPLKSPSKSATKSLAKALSSKSGGKYSRSKSPSISPSTEYPTEEPSVKIDEDSEEWKAFQEMQERIKQTVQKTRTNLTKLASTTVADSPDGSVKPVTKPTGKSWVSFEKGESDKDDTLTDIDKDVIANDNLDLSWAAYDDNITDTDLIETGEDLLHLDVTPVPSPRISPRVPSNSLRTSQEDLSQRDLLSEEITPAADMDLLGLGDTSEPQASSSAPTAVIINEDLLGLGIDTQDGQTSDPFSVPLSSQKPKTVELLFSSVGDSAQSSQRSSPCVFDNDLLGGPPTDSPNHQSERPEFSAAQLANSIVDDFLGLSECEQPQQPVESAPAAVFDPFQTIIEDSLIADNAPSQKLAPENPFTSSNMTNISAHRTSPINPFDTSNADVLGTDLLSGPSEPATTDSPNPWFSQTIEEVSDNPVDLFGAPVEQPSTIENKTLPYETAALHDFLAPSSNPIDIDSSFQTTVPTPPKITSEPLFPEVTAPVVNLAASSTLNEPSSQEQEPKLSENEEFTVIKAVKDFDEDFFGKATTVSDSVDAFSAWGLDTVESKSSNNPFLDSSFSSEAVSAEVDDTGDVNAGGKNPFLSDDFATFSSETITQKNPFLQDSSETSAPSTNLSAFMFEDKADGMDFFQSRRELDTKTNDTDIFEANANGTDTFDPFGVKGISQPSALERGPVSIFEAVSAAGDNQLVEPEGDDDDDDFAGVPMKLEIKPTARKPAGKAPPIPPPPKGVPMPFRENPFDKESPPEEEFAKFETSEDQDSSAKLEHTMSMSTESSTPEEEEMPGPLEPYHSKFEGTGWHLMLRQPTKKKITGNRYWKNVFVRLVMAKDGPVLKLYTDEGERDAFQELPLQPCYSLSEIALQQYDQYGKIHTVKLQYIFYRERVGLRAERITPNFVRKPKPTMILDHSPQVSELLKFGSLKKDYLRTFLWEVEDALMKIEAHRDKTLSYTKDEVSVDVWDEFEVEINKAGHIVHQKSRVRIFCLAFVTGMPWCELGVNDKRRKGKEVVGRHDIIPVKTEDWIKIQDYEFHSVIEKEAFEKTNTIKFHPLDGCQFELMRFRARPKENRELPLQAKVQQIIKGTHVEIRCDLLVTGYHANSKKHGQFPCEDIEVHFPIPEQWIYLFRYERRFGYGSKHSTTRKPGKIKGLERLTMMAQGNLSPALLEASVGTAKYENVYHAVVWRINRLPERNEGAYKSHLFRLTMDLGPHDEVPTEYEQYSDIEFTMPSSTVSKTQVRSVSVANPNPPEKWVKYVGKYQMKVEIEHIQLEDTEDNNESET